MFRKLVSNLSFSPALVGELAFYAKRLRKEDTTRKLGLIFVAIAVLVQSIAFINPPQSANASSSSDFVVGGLGTGSSRSINNFLEPYDNNTRKLKQVMNYFGVTRDEIASSKFGKWKVGSTYSWGFESRFSYKQGERSFKVKNSSGEVVKTVYARPAKLTASSSTDIYGWIGKSEKLGWFAIMQYCGNLVTLDLPQKKNSVDPEPEVINKIIETKSAINLDQNSKNAEETIANASDSIQYTISAKNAGNVNTAYTFQENLSDVLQYANLTSDISSGTYNKENKTLSWPTITIKPNQTITKTFRVEILKNIPFTNTGKSDATSFDCIMTNVFGNSVNIKVNCPTVKTIENNVSQLPKTGPAENFTYSAIALAIVVYFYVRSRIMVTEVRLIRKNLSRGNL
jgi:uncharacterized repeat protein (TIGR01451 family)